MFAQVRSIAVDPSGQWLASGGDDGTLRLWESRTGRCLRTWALGGKVACVAWCPAPAMRMLSAAVGKAVLLLPSGALHLMAVWQPSLAVDPVDRRSLCTSFICMAVTCALPQGTSVQGCRRPDAVALHSMPCSRPC